jgi:hypothetical protein
MPKRLSILLLILCIVCCSASAQNTSIKGTITDTANQKKLYNASIVLMRKSDSTLVTYTRSDKTGHFSFDHLPSEKLAIIIFYPSFADYVDDIDLTTNPNLDLGNINLINKSTLLKEIVIRQNNTMRMKGDTLEFAADSFKVRPNASAEDMLKLLPGIQVDKNGKIIAQGKEVQKVLVDGEEFFSDDPTVATRGIRADAVDKVQVYDKKSDKAEFTGIDDGERTKTINLKLKEDKKNGYFGKLSAGGGLKDKFNNEGMINFFKGKRKVSAFGTMSNTGQTGLGREDEGKYSGGDDYIDYGDEDRYNLGQSDAFEFNDNGLPKVWSGGAHFSNKWNENKNNVNLSYLYKKLDVAGETGSRAQYILPDTLYYMNQSGSNYSQRMRNSLNGKYELQIDSSSTLKIIINGYKTNTQNFNTFFSEALDDHSNPVNRSNRNTSGKADESALNANLQWFKKFKKQGRTLTVKIAERYSDTDSDGFLNALNSFYDSTGEVAQQDTINQRKYNQSKLFNLNAKITYTEPINKDNFIELNYGFSNTNSTANRVTYDYDNGKYDVLNEQFTNDYDFRINANGAGFLYQIAKKKYNFSFGSNLAYQQYRQRNNLKDSSFTYYRTNLFPKATFRYMFKPTTMLEVRYDGRTQQPTIQQIQPVSDNNDPLNVYIGNPDLKPSFNHSMSFFFYNFKVLKERAIIINGWVNVTQNAITSNNVVDESARKIYQSVNANGIYTYGGYVDYRMKVAPKIRMDFTISNTGNKFINFVNNDRNSTFNNNYNAAVGGRYTIENKMGINIRANLNYNTSVSSIRKDVKTKYWTTRYELETYKELPLKFAVGSDVYFDLREKTSVFDKNTNAIIWNGWVSRRLFKETCSLKFSINDILNQNIGFRRDIQSNFISENTYSVMRRIWLLSFTWNFTKNNGQPQNQ